MRLAILGALLIMTATAALAQISIGGSGLSPAIRVQGTVGIGNGESNLLLANPNTSGQFLFLFPHIAQMQPGEEVPLRLHAIGQKDQIVLVWKRDQSVQPNEEAVAGGEKGTSASVLHTSAIVEVPSMLSGTSHVLRIDVPGVRAGSAISVSPSDELPGLLTIAHASAPVDCVVIVKLVNPGPFVQAMSMQFSVGAIAPRTTAEN